MKAFQTVKRFARFVLYSALGKEPGNLDNQVAELRRTFPAPHATGDMPPSQEEWHCNTKRLYKLVMTADPRFFLRWDVIQSTMFVTHAPYVRLELSRLKSRHDWQARWHQAIEESGVGGPMPYLLYPRSSGNLIHNAHHLAAFEDRTKQRIDSFDTVVEFGGGYGCMCRLMRRLGFTGRYVIFDLPQFSALQRFYLSATGVQVECISDFAHLERAVESRHGPSLFLSTWALSETPMELREKMIDLVKAFDSFLFAYQDHFNEVDNISFFSRLGRDLTRVAWHQEPIAHIPGNTYAIGSLRNPPGIS